MPRNITTIELKRETRDKLDNLRHMGHSFDDVVNQLIKDHEEIDKYIGRYIKGAKGKCICKVILGHAVIANHHFDCNGKCKKCNIQGPINVEDGAIILNETYEHTDLERRVLLDQAGVGLGAALASGTMSVATAKATILGTKR